MLELNDQMAIRVCENTHKYQQVLELIGDYSLEQTALIEKWNLQKYQYEKSCAFSQSYQEISCFEQIYGEVPITRVVRLIPDCLCSLLYDKDFHLVYENVGTNKFSGSKRKAVVKYTDDTLHEIGHALWLNLVPKKQRKLIINSLVERDKRRVAIPENDLPVMHKEYASLVGAFSGQFLLSDYQIPRMNDLEEHYARNFDYLLKGKPLIVLPNSKSTISDFFRFYAKQGLIDRDFAKVFRMSITKFLQTKPILEKKIEEMVDGDPITTEDMIRIMHIRKWINERKS